MAEQNTILDESANQEQESQYVHQFVEKLIADTYQKRLKWNCESRDRLLAAICDAAGESTHPLFAPSKIYPGKLFYRSMFWKEPDHVTTICGDGYYVRIKDSFLYLMRTCTHYIVGNNIKKGYELYLTTGGSVHPLCAGYDADDEYAEMLERLYTAILGIFVVHQINPEAKSIIDSYMNDNPDSESVPEPAEE